MVVSCRFEGKWQWWLRTYFGKDLPEMEGTEIAMRVELVLCTYLILICCVLIVEDAEDIVCFVASSPSKGTGIIYRATPQQRPAPTSYRRSWSIFEPKRTSLMSSNNTQSQADATITPSTQKMLVNGTTLPLSSLPNPLRKRNKIKRQGHPGWIC